MLVSVLAYAGLRPQEALALHWSDLRHRTLLIGAPKTGRSRAVELFAPLAADLAEWRLARGHWDDISEQRGRALVGDHMEQLAAACLVRQREGPRRCSRDRQALPAPPHLCQPPGPRGPLSHRGCRARRTLPRGVPAHLRPRLPRLRPG